MRYLFVMRNTGNARNFESMLRELASRGHEIHLAFELTRRPTGLPARLTAEFPNVTTGAAPERTDRWIALGKDTRFGIDYLRYLRPPYLDTPALRGRARKSSPKLIAALADLPGFRSPRGLDLLSGALRAVDRAIPTDPTINAWLREQNPDMLLVSPLVGGHHQTEYVRSARELGIRTGLCVTSWDNLTNKGLIRDKPDHVYVWNEHQRIEAIDLHHISPDAVHAVGAHSYDHWFGWSASTTPEEFREGSGLPAGRPYLLYLCSSMFIAPTEPEYVRRLIQALRADPRTKDLGVLVRPHPSSGPQLWKDGPLDGLEGVTVWPPVGDDPNNAESRAAYYDSIHHCSVVSGINTSALIESAIVGRPVFTLLVPEFKGTQEGTIHFRYLQRANGGPLTIAETMDQHLDQIAESLHGDVDPDGWNIPFVKSFVRPHGLDVPGAPRFAALLVQAAQAPAPAARPYKRFYTPALIPLATFLGSKRAVHKILHRSKKIARALFNSAAGRVRIALGRSRA